MANRVAKLSITLAGFTVSPALIQGLPCGALLWFSLWLISAHVQTMVWAPCGGARDTAEHRKTLLMYNSTMFLRLFTTFVREPRDQNHQLGR